MQLEWESKKMPEVEAKFFEKIPQYDLHSINPNELQELENKRKQDISQLMEMIPSVSCPVPQQDESTKYDCGMYLVHNVKDFFGKFLYITSKTSDITNKFSSYFASDDYKPINIQTLRYEILEDLARYLLDNLSYIFLLTIFYNK